jgi:phage repressor protein C with HTH and peptisase S24 domain
MVFFPIAKKSFIYDDVPMLKHSQVWRAIDRLAQEYEFSASGLARRSGLDPTTFNKSKRTTREGKLRWPSTESVSKVLTATGASLGEFVTYMEDGPDGGVFRNIPLIGFAQAGAEGFFDDAGYPAGGGWDEIPFPDVGDPHAYALEISGDSMEPAYRDGDTVIISPGASVRRGDRVVTKTKAGEVMAKVLRRKTAHRLELISLNSDHEDRLLAVEDVDWVARIVWVSQ